MMTKTTKTKLVIMLTMMMTTTTTTTMMTTTTTTTTTTMTTTTTTTTTMMTTTTTTTTATTTTMMMMMMMDLCLCFSGWFGCRRHRDHEKVCHYQETGNAASISNRPRGSLSHFLNSEGLPRSLCRKTERVEAVKIPQVQ